MFLRVPLCWGHRSVVKGPETPRRGLALEGNPSQPSSPSARLVGACGATRVAGALWGGRS